MEFYNPGYCLSAKRDKIFHPLKTVAEFNKQTYCKAKIYPVAAAATRAALPLTHISQWCEVEEWNLSPPKCHFSLRTEPARQ